METQPEHDTPSIEPRDLTDLPLPPMLVVHKGWFGDRVTERQASELIEEDRQRRLKAKRS